jgi:hypothetical protein
MAVDSGRPLRGTAFRELLAANSGRQKTPRGDSGAFLKGKLYDDPGKRMSPSSSSDNGICGTYRNIRRSFRP